MKLKIAETFHSIQGEGYWVGTPMHFIRLAGCSVGKPHADGPELPTHNKAWQCHTYDGRPFWCDTDFTKQIELDPKEILNETWERHICITGGEPLMEAHWPAVQELLLQALARDFRPHLETSGTIFRDFKYFDIWTVVSPKQGVLDEMIDRAAEVKLLVDENFDDKNIPLAVLAHRKVCIQPVNDITQLNQANLNHCMDILRDHPAWKLSVQLHKLLGLR